MLLDLAITSMAPGLDVDSLGLVIQRDFARRSVKRVNSVDIHPSEPWILVGLDSGDVYIWDYQEEDMVHLLQVSTSSPVISANFIARNHWIVVAADYVRVRVYNYVTWTKIAEFTAHVDNIKWIDVHPDCPFVLSSSDDNLIKLWDWDNNWRLKQTFRGHFDSVKHVSFNKKDSNIFASASLDGTAKVWRLNSPDPICTFEGHQQSVNWVDHLRIGKDLYLITASDDCTAKVWDLEGQRCIQALVHAHKVSSVCSYPDRPIIITGSEDGTISIWNVTDFSLLRSISYCLRGVSAIACMANSKRILVGHDDGIIMLKMGRAFPAASMHSGGGTIWERESIIQNVNVLAMSSRKKDGGRLPLAKDIERCELYPENIMHSSDGRYFVVSGDGNYVIYSVSSGKRKLSGSALEFVWSAAGGHAVRVSASAIQVYNKSGKMIKASPPVLPADCIFGGRLLSVCSENCIKFYDWADGSLIHQINVNVRNVYWADCVDLVALASVSSFDILKHNKSTKQVGVAPMNVIYTCNDRVRTGLWTDSCFIYINSSWCLKCCVGGEVWMNYKLNHPTSYLDRPMDLLGYFGSQIYLIDIDFNIVRYTLSQSLNEYMVCVLRGDLKGANDIFSSIPADKYNSIVHFLDSRGVLNNAKLDISKISAKLKVDEKVFPVKVGLEEARSRTRWRQ